MKIGIVGKGGVGKTTLSALICEEYRQRGRRVLAIDTDSNPNLAISLGLDEDTARRTSLASSAVSEVPRRSAAGTSAA
ncbi:MAG: AAA family ATPase [Actinobacteria bacterium]|nr:AAA family ATPase [Actinomycetota bacterium]